MFFLYIALPVLYVVGMVLIHHGITLLRTPEPPPEPPHDERRTNCVGEGLDRTIVDVSPRPVPFSGDLANRTNSGKPIRPQEK